jgi:DnaJ-class molecular chaperone
MKRKILYFVSVSTIEELKKEYKRLAKQYHPDLNRDTDTTKIMQDINNEYEQLFEMLKDSKTDKQGHNSHGNYRDVVNELVKYDSITIDIIGSWVWVYGDSYSIKDSLKSLGFRWSGSNKKWYWTEQEITKKKKAMTYDYKKKKYGIETVQTAKKKTKTAIQG